MLSEAQLVEVQRVSGRLFNNKHRLEVAVAVAVAEPGIVYARSLANGLAAPENQVGDALHRFAAAGLMIEHPRVGGSEPLRFERLPVPFWEAMKALVPTAENQAAHRP